MPTNCLVQPYVAGVQQEVVCPLFSPDGARDARRRFRREPVPYLSRANSFYAANGVTPSRGWVLLRRGDYAKLNPFATNLRLLLNGFVGGVPGLALYNLSFTQGRCVTRGRAADPDSLYLVELCDGQGLVHNPWFATPLDASYNVRAPAYPTSATNDPAGFYSPSLRSGAFWTWDYLVRDLWERMPQLGAYPGLPVAPQETAEGFAYPGVSCWEALDRVLRHLGCTVATDLTSPAAPYGIVQYGAADAAFAAKTALYAGLLEDDLEYLDGGAGRVPGSFTVYFHRRNQF